MKIRRPCDIISVCLEGESAVEEDTKTLNPRERCDDREINIKDRHKNKEFGLVGLHEKQ